MTEYNAKVAPFVDITFYVTGMYGTQRPTHIHVGIDLATSNPEPMYSILDGVVIYKDFSNVRGNYIVVKGDNGFAFLYQHMAEPSPKNIGDRVQIGEFLGTEGLTGEITGLHLHMEMQDLSTGRDWHFGTQIEYYINPADYMEFPNETGISVYYDGNPIEPILKSKNSLKWLKYMSKKKRIIY